MPTQVSFVMFRPSTTLRHLDQLALTARNLLGQSLPGRVLAEVRQAPLGSPSTSCIGASPRSQKLDDSVRGPPNLALRLKPYFEACWPNLISECRSAGRLKRHAASVGAIASAS